MARIWLILFSVHRRACPRSEISFLIRTAKQANMMHAASTLLRCKLVSLDFSLKVCSQSRHIPEWQVAQKAGCHKDQRQLKAFLKTANLSQFLTPFVSLGCDSLDKLMSMAGTGGLYGGR